MNACLDSIADTLQTARLILYPGEPSIEQQGWPLSRSAAGVQSSLKLLSMAFTFFAKSWITSVFSLTQTILPWGPQSGRRHRPPPMAVAGMVRGKSIASRTSLHPLGFMLVIWSRCLESVVKNWNLQDERNCNQDGLTCPWGTLFHVGPG